MEFPGSLNRWDRYHIITQLAIYKWHVNVCKWDILPIGGLYGTSHLLREPETTIDQMLNAWYIFTYLWQVFLGK